MQDDVGPFQVAPLLGLGEHEPHDEGKHLVTSYGFRLQKSLRATICLFGTLLNGYRDIIGCSRIGRGRSGTSLQDA